MDLNADLGEGHDDAALMPFITSANVCCGVHAGSPLVAARTLALARSHGVRIGAHPSWDDREHFGRRELAWNHGELRDLIFYQLGALRALAPFDYVKPHGALYNQAARDPLLAKALAEVVHAFDPTLALLGLAGSAMRGAAESRGLRFIGEAFADRRYADDGSLVPRSQPGAVLHDPAEAAAQAVRLARTAQSICLHGDTPGALAIARAVRSALQQAGIEVSTF